MSAGNAATNTMETSRELIKKTDAGRIRFPVSIDKFFYFGCSKILGSISLFISTLFTLEDKAKPPKSIALE